MVVVMTMMAVMWLRKRRGREQQRQGQDDQLLHGAIVARRSRAESVEIAIGIFLVIPQKTQRKEARIRAESA